MKVCFVGSGSIGSRHIRNFSAVCGDLCGSPEIHLLRATKKELPAGIGAFITKEIYDIENLEKTYDAIFIVNPTYLHRKYIELLKHHSKVFFVEKPVFGDADINIDDLRLPDGNKYYVACPLRYSAVLAEAGKLVKTERIFSARAVSSSYLPDWREGIDYRKTYSANREEGGGVYIDLIHEMDYLINFFGFPSEGMMMRGKYSELDITSDDLAVYLLRYKDKIVEIHLDYFGRVPMRYFEVYTRNDVWKFDIIGSRIIRNGQVESEVNEYANDKYLAEMQYFVELIRSGSASDNSLQHSLDVLKAAVGGK